MERVQEILARNMKLARERLGYSQMKLAEISDLSIGFIAEIETGKKFPSAKSLQNISEALGLKPYQLFVDEKDEGHLAKHELLTKVYRELKKQITMDLERVIKKYSS